MNEKRTDVSLWRASIVLLPFILLVSLPILLAGYYADDAINGLTRRHLLLTHDALFSFSSGIFLQWLHGGRIFPFALFSTYYFTYIFHSVMVYQAARMGCIWLSLFCVAWFVKLVSQQRSSALLALFFIPLFWSVREACDPLTSFAILLPLVTIFIMLSLCFLLKAREGNTRCWIAGSIFMYGCALCTYEVSFAALGCLMSVAWFYRKSVRQFYWVMLPYALVTAIYVIPCLLLRHMAPAAVYDGVQMGTVGGLINTFRDQALSGLPLSYVFFKGFFPPFSSVMISVNMSYFAQLLPSVCVSALFFYSAYQLLPRIILHQSAKNIFFSVGFFLVVVPSLLIGMSKKYQVIVHPGVGYLPVYLEYIGFALMLLVGCSFLAGRTYWKKVLRFVIVMSLSILLGISVFLNVYVVRDMNHRAKNPSELIAFALQKNFFSGLPADVLIVKHHSNVLSPEFFSQYSERHVKVIEVGEEKVVSGPGYFLKAVTQPDSAFGYVILGQLLQEQASQEGGYRIESVSVLNPVLFIATGRRHYLFSTGRQVTLDDVLDTVYARLLPAVSHFSLNKLRQDKAEGWVVVALPAGKYQYRLH